MRIQSHAATDRKTPHRIPFAFQCDRCETIELTSTRAMPDGWIVAEIGGDDLVCCPDCTIDLIAGEIQ